MNRFDYLEPSIGPVFDGLEDHEKIYALEQMGEYLPLRTLPGQNGKSAIYRLGLTEDQRQMIAAGADVLIEIIHFGGPMAPSRAMILNDNDLTDEQRRNFLRWFAVQTQGPYREDLKP